MKILKNVLWLSFAYTFVMIGIASTASAQARAIPEIDAATAGSALVLVIGGWFVVKSRLRRK